MIGCIQFNPFSIFNDLFQDLQNQGFCFFKRITPLFIIPDNQIHMAKHTVILIFPDKLQHLLIIPLVVFLLASPFLKILCPEFLILRLMD